ncbi:P-type DNA transfer protein VirB5 [Methylorubrum sp. SB2]|uniref:P-type DNA transfer protein VirB5 n=1 Tax=Methylorubrum subtropicum TaxID=3138812 RepID=UPI00313CBF05
MRRSVVAMITLAVSLGTAGPIPAFELVYDPTAVAKLVEQARQMERQIATLTDQLTEAKRLYDSFNKITDAGEIAGLLNTPALRKALPADFSQIESLVAGSGSGNFADSLNGYLAKNRVYTANAGNDFYAAELERIARRTGTAHTLGEAVYDAAAKRVDQLDLLRRQIGQAHGAKDVADLSARLQAESALLQNDVLRLQGLAMIQRAQRDMDAQRERERGRQLVDEMKAAVQ